MTEYWARSYYERRRAGKSDETEFEDDDYEAAKAEMLENDWEDVPVGVVGPDVS